MNRRTFLRSMAGASAGAALLDGAALARPFDDPETEMLAELARRKLARSSHLEFMRYCWSNRSRPFLVGVHTKAITDWLDQALVKLEQGISSYGVVTVPFRHGKSQIISRDFPPYVLGRYPDLELILGTYGASLSESLSRDARETLRGQKYSVLFPETKLSKASASVKTWQIDGRQGKLNAMGIEGAATGKGADVLIIDDYLKGRADAESPTIRNKIWENFRDNFFSRLAPVHIVIILATRWHVDDLTGRILAMMEDPEGDPEFPQFEVIKFKAREITGTTSEGKPVYKYLFPERFGPEWYSRMYALLGSYGAAALLDGDPVLRGGNMIKTDRIQYWPAAQFPSDLHWVRYWDLASTEDERDGEDPDFTVGTRMAVKMIDGAPWLFIDDCRWCRAEAPARNKLIRETAIADGPRVWQGIEANGGYKDAATTLKKVLEGISTVYAINVHQDKVVRAGDVEPIFEAGHVVMREKAWWATTLVANLSEFPSGAHDDHTDTVSGGYQLALQRLIRALRHGGGVGKGARRRVA